MPQSTFAAVDLGSNSFHLIVARYEHGHVQVIDQLRETVRLAAGLNDEGDLTAAASKRAIDCLARFGQRLRGVPTDQVRALGTSTLRRARHPRQFLERAEAALGQAIEIISSHEEARLIYLGVVQGLPSSETRRLVIDIGGGSTELIIGQGNKPLHLESVTVGCVGVSQEFFDNGTLSRAALKKAQTAVALELRPLRTTFHETGWSEVIGSSGTVLAVERVLRESGWTKQGISRQGLKKLRRALEGVGSVNELDLPGLSDDRRPVFAGGVAILSACFGNLELDQMQVSYTALREGALYDLIGRVEHQDPRDTSVRAFAKRNGVDAHQAERVCETALLAFDQVAESWELLPADRNHLRWAAELHEVGLAVAHDHYNRHGGYLVQHASLNGFSEEEQLVVATLITGHRRKLTRDVFAALPKRLMQRTMRLCVLLRIAVLLHRARLADATPPIKWRTKSDTLSLSIDPAWLSAHPLTKADLAQEGEQVKKIGISMKVRAPTADTSTAEPASLAPHQQ